MYQSLLMYEFEAGFRMRINDGLLVDAHVLDRAGDCEGMELAMVSCERGNPE